VTDLQKADGIRRLLGLEVSAVCFVRDYVELHFEGEFDAAWSHALSTKGGSA